MFPPNWQVNTMGKIPLPSETIVTTLEYDHRGYNINGFGISVTGTQQWVDLVRLLSCDALLQLLARHHNHMVGMHTQRVAALHRRDLVGSSRQALLVRDEAAHALARGLEICRGRIGEIMQAAVDVGVSVLHQAHHSLYDRARLLGRCARIKVDQWFAVDFSA